MEINNNVRIFKFLDANVTRDIEYSHENFIVRSTIGHWYPVNHSVVSFTNQLMS